MKIAVISMIKEPWGGSEELWAAMADEALSTGHKVFLSALDCGSISPKVERLLGKGLQLNYRRGFIKAELSFMKRVIKKGSILLMNRILNPFRSVFDWSPDVILYVGTAY